MQPIRQVAIAWVGCAVLVGMGCAGSQAPWSVKPEERARFEAATRVCRMLTDGSDGELRPERFETCMTRRDWRRQNVFERLLGCD